MNLNVGQRAVIAANILIVRREVNNNALMYRVSVAYNFAQITIVIEYRILDCQMSAQEAAREDQVFRV